MADDEDIRPEGCLSALLFWSAVLIGTFLVSAVFIRLDRIDKAIGLPPCEWHDIQYVCPEKAAKDSR